jgi:hypothetical protein
MYPVDGHPIPPLMSLKRDNGKTIKDFDDELNE